MIRTTPLRRTILHLVHIFLTEALTLITCSAYRREKTGGRRDQPRRAASYTGRSLLWQQGNFVTYARLSTSGPFSVTATECSKWADRLLSLVTAVHLSASTSTSLR